MWCVEWIKQLKWWSLEREKGERMGVGVGEWCRCVDFCVDFYLYSSVEAATRYLLLLLLHVVVVA